MRISTSWAQQLGVNAMNAQQVKMSKTQMQLSAGLKNLTPSDDPAAAVKALGLQESIDKTTQYQDNIAQTRARLSIEEGSLQTSENILFRAKELTVQSLNSTLTLQDREAIKSEIDQLLQEMVGVANTKNANGEYIFSGDLSTTPAVAWDVEVGSYVYQGGINQRVLDIAPERRVADGDLGSNIYSNISSVSQEANATVDGVEINQRSVFDTLQSLSNALSQKYEVPEAVITGDRFMRLGANYSAPATTTFDLSSDKGRTITGSSISFPLNYDTTTGGTNADFNIVVDGDTADPVNITLAKDYTTQAELLTDIESQILVSSSVHKGSVTVDPAADPIQFKTSSTAASPTLEVVATGNAGVTDFTAVAGLTGVIAQPVTVTLNADYANIDEVVAAINSTPGLTAIGVEARSDGHKIEFFSTTKGKNSSVSIYDKSPVAGTFLTDFGFSSKETGNGVDLGGSITGIKPATVYDYSNVSASFELNDEAGNKTTITLDQNYTNLATLTKAINTQIIGSPVEGKIEVDTSANPITFKSISSGTSAAVQIKQISGNFLKDNGFTSGDTGRVFSKTGNDVLADLDAALDNFLKVRTTVGARMRALDDQEAQNEKFIVDIQTTLSDVQDLDYAAAISQFNIEQSALQAAQQAYSRVQNLSLFNFL